MSNNEVKKAIILDMDCTLETRYHIQGCDNEKIMILRPGIDELLKKLQEAKERGIDIILCSEAGNEWVQRFLNLKPELKSVFNRIYTHDNKFEFPRRKTDGEMLIHDEAKPITLFGYDSILFIDDFCDTIVGNLHMGLNIDVKNLKKENLKKLISILTTEFSEEFIGKFNFLKEEFNSKCNSWKEFILEFIEDYDYENYDEIDELKTINDFLNEVGVKEYSNIIEDFMDYLKDDEELSAYLEIIQSLLDEAPKEKLNQLFPLRTKDVTIFSGYRYSEDSLPIYGILNMMSNPNLSEEDKEKISQCIEQLNKEPGCQMMCSEIDDFMKKDFIPGLTRSDEKYRKEYRTYKKTLDTIKNSYYYNGEANKKLLNKYMSRDREYPFEGMDIVLEGMDIVPTLNMKAVVNKLLARGINITIGEDREDNKGEKIND